MDSFQEPDDGVDEANFRILSATEKQEAIGIYRKVMDKVKKVDPKEEEFGQMIDKMTNHVNNQNAALQQVGVNELMTMDARTIAISSELSYSIVKKFHSESKFDYQEFLRLLRQRVLKHSRKQGLKVNNEIPNDKSCKIRYEQMAGTGIAYSKIHYQMPCLNRPFKQPIQDVPPAVSKERRKITRTSPTQTSQPTQYDASNMANEADESEKRLKFIHHKLKRLERQQDHLPFIQVALNPTSFGTTVENFFHFAFLARQQKITLIESDNGVEPWVHTIEEQEPTTTEKQNDNCLSTQSILSFDQESYHAMIETLGITRPAFN